MRPQSSLPTRAFWPFDEPAPAARCLIEVGFDDQVAQGIATFARNTN